MRSYRIVFAPEARDQLDRLHAYVAAAAGPDVATGFVDSILDHIAGLSDFPMRGTTRDDIRPGLRMIGWRRKVTIALIVEESDVVILGVFYGGRDSESLLADD